MPLNPIFTDFLKTDFDNMYSLGVEKLREYYNRSWDDFKGAVVEVGAVVDRVVTTSNRDTPIRIYYPKDEGIHPLFIFIHGGGFVLGSIEVYDSICRKITNNVNCVVLSIEYGLAPEHKFPQPLEECYQVTRWVFQNAVELNVNPAKIGIGGDSVGGTMSAVISQLSRDRGEFRLVYQVLINAILDLAGETKSRVENGRGYRLTAKGIAWFNQQHLNDLSEAKNPLASPLLAANFAGLPAACIITSEYDPLRDEGENYARRLAEAGVEVCLKRYDGIIHGFFNMQRNLAEARDALALVCEKIKAAFSA
ncbi:MAG TPA: alpha/beta hydrolase [Firmicutes bacterium]|jgi:acetyl esterase|nr:alpha/beta hydrolase [Bacillota bacterium]